MKSILLTSTVVLAAAFFGVATNSANTKELAPPTIGLSANEQEQDDVKSASRKAFMRGKLASNQKIVEGLSVKNFGMIAEGALAVKTLVKGQHWFVLNTPEYKRLSAEMEIAATRLEQAANSKNVDAAALRYFDLTLNCVDCHNYIETQKY
jgi:hypothetical protein